MTTLYKAVAAVALLASAAVSAGAQVSLPGELKPDENTNPTRQGTRGANFLEIGVDARGQAMGGALASWAEGPSALYWNPAGAASTENLALEATRQDLYGDLDITHNFFGVTVPAIGGVIGAHVITLNSGDIRRTTPAFPNGGDPTFGITFSWTSTAIGLSYARRLTDRLSIGATGKYISEGLSDASTSWVGADVGTQFNTGLYGVTLGAAVSNIGGSAAARGTALRRKVDTDQFANQRTNIEYQTQQTELPTLFRFSVGVDLLGRSSSVFAANSKNKLLTEVAFSDAIDTDLQLGLGAEYSFNNLLFLRAGKHFYNDERATGRAGQYGLSGGVGLRLPVASRAISVDYGYTSLGDLQNIQVFTIGFGH